MQGEMSNKLKAVFQMGGPARGGIMHVGNWANGLPMLQNPDFSALLHG